MADFSALHFYDIQRKKRKRSWFTPQNISTNINGTTKLFESSALTVSKFLGNPSILREDAQYAHIQSNTALVSFKHECFIWNYTALDIDPTCLGFQFKTETLSLLVHPKNDPGLVVVSDNGKIVYWVSVTASVVNDLLDQVLCFSGEIPLWSSETVQNLAPLGFFGVVAVTSRNRLFCISFSGGLEVHPIGSSEGIIGSVKNKLFTPAWRRDLVAIKPGKTDGKECLVFVLNKQLTLSAWLCSLDGSSEQLLESDLTNVVCDLVNLLYPDVSETLIGLDVEVAPKLDLKFVLTSFQNETGTSLLLLALDWTPNFPVHFKVVFNQIVHTKQDCSNARLSLSLDEEAIFIHFDHTVVMVETKRRLDRHLQESVFLKEEVNVLGAAPTDTSLVLVTSQGVLQVERTPNRSENSVKAKLEQVIKYSSNTSPLEFKPSKAELAAEKDELEAQIHEVANDVLTKIEDSPLHTVQKRLSCMISLREYSAAFFDLSTETAAFLESSVQHLAFAAELVSSEHQKDIQTHIKALTGLSLEKFVTQGSDANLLDPVGDEYLPDEVLVPCLSNALSNSQTNECFASSWLCSDQVQTCLERLVESAPDMGTSHLHQFAEVVCASFSNCTETAAASRVLTIMLNRGFRKEVIKLADEYSILAPLSTILVDDWLFFKDEDEEEDAQEALSVIFLNIDRVGERFAHSVFTYLCEKEKTEKKLDKRVKSLEYLCASPLDDFIASPYVGYLQTFCQVYNRPDIQYRVEFKLGNYELCAKSLQQAVDQSSDLEHKLDFATKLYALARIKCFPDIALKISQLIPVLSANIQLKEQLVLQSIMKDESLTPCAQAVLDHCREAAEKSPYLSATDVWCGLTFAPVSAGISRLNLAFALVLLIRLDLGKDHEEFARHTVQRLILETDFSVISMDTHRPLLATGDQLMDSLALQEPDKFESLMENSLLNTVLRSSPALRMSSNHVARYLDKKFWKVSTARDVVSRLFSWASDQELDLLLDEFDRNNEKVDQLLKEIPDIGEWVQVISENAMWAEFDHQGALEWLKTAVLDREERGIPECDYDIPEELASLCVYG